VALKSSRSLLSLLRSLILSLQRSNQFDIFLLGFLGGEALVQIFLESGVLGLRLLRREGGISIHLTRSEPIWKGREGVCEP